LIGSCTNSSYEDIALAASIAKQVTDKKKIKIRISITPGSEVVRYTIERDGFIDTFEKMTVLQMLADHVLVWDREGADKEERNTIVHSLIVVTFLNVLMEIKHIGFQVHLNWLPPQLPEI
jgi:aconitate hydratase